MERGFYVVGQPQLSPIEELESLIVELDQCPTKTETLREQQRQLVDSKIYLKSGDRFVEIETIKCGSKVVHVRLPSGAKQCLPRKYLDEKGRCTRHLKTMEREFYYGWRARHFILSRIEQTEKRCVQVKRELIPDLVRAIRNSGGDIPEETVQRLVTHYRSTH